MKLIEKDSLIALYNRNSKHSGYQILPRLLKPLIQEDVEQIIPRFEQERIDWVNSQISLEGKQVVDIGGNTGFFSFEAIDRGAMEVIYIEGNPNHAHFVSKAADLLNLNVKVSNIYFDFKTHLEGVYPDVVFLFNVIHHLGDDFGDQSITKSEALEYMKDAIKYFSEKTEYLVLQMGFCWKGDRNKLLFKDGTKHEMIDFVKSATMNEWEIQSIGIAEIAQSKTVYRPLSESNIERDDTLGEFRNRPIFILKAIKNVG